MQGLFKSVVQSRALGANQSERLSWLWGEVQLYHEDDNVEDRLSQLTLNMVKTTSYPLGRQAMGNPFRFFPTNSHSHGTLFQLPGRTAG